jgi:hypothetical protein
MSFIEIAESRRLATLDAAVKPVRPNGLVPHERIPVSAAHGRLTLTGEVPINLSAKQRTTLSEPWSA